MHPRNPNVHRFCCRHLELSNADTSLASQSEVENYYKAQGNDEPSSATRFTNIINDLKKKPKHFIQGLRVLETAPGSNIATSIFGSATPVRPILARAFVLLHMHRQTWLTSRPESHLVLSDLRHAQPVHPLACPLVIA
jgi:hypothetical protein